MLVPVRFSCLPRSASFAVFFLAACAVFGCGPGPVDSPKPRLSSLQRWVFTPSCALPDCHTDSSAQMGLVLSSGRSYASLVGRPAVGVPDMMRVDPRRPRSSYLVRKFGEEGIVGERMPLGRPPLPDSLVLLVERWIARGAPDD